MVKWYAYHSDDPTDPRCPSVQGPDTITEVSLHNERDNCKNDGNVYGGKMGIFEVSHVAKSSNKPIIDIGPSEDGLNSFQQEDEINCSRFA
jgi:hypothetical protein